MASTPPEAGRHIPMEKEPEIPLETKISGDAIAWDAADSADDDLGSAAATSSRATSKFAFSTAHLHQLSQLRSTDALDAFGGIRGLAAGLRTDTRAGLGVDEDRLDGAVSRQDALTAARAASMRNTKSPPTETHLTDILHVPGLLANNTPQGHTDRRLAFGENRLPKPKPKSFLQLAWLAFNDKLIFLLLTSATISLALGIYEAVAANDDDGSNLEWVESVTIMAAVFVIVFASAANDYHKNYRFEKLNAKKQEGWVTVVRSGRAQRISVFDVLVGDILRIEAGDILHADGVLVEGSRVECDESSLTGEADIMHKSPATAAGTADGAQPTTGGEAAAAAAKQDVFLFSGTKVVHGIGAMLVTAVGSKSTHGRIQLSLRGTVEQTPLQHKLGRLAKYIIVVGFIVGILFFLAQFIRWCVNLQYFEGSPEDKGESFLDIFMLAVTVVVIGVPEGLSLAVAVALAFGTSRMLKDNNLVRLLRSCEVMGNATTICSDKTGTLTQNKMTVVAGTIGTEQFGAHDDEHVGDGDASASSSPQSWRTIGPREFVKSLDPDLREILRAMVALNTTAFEQDPAERGTGTQSDSLEGETFVGTATETALLRLGREHLGMGPLTQERENADIVETLPFNAVRKWMAVVVGMPGDEQGNGKKYRLLVKGAAEILLDRCSELIENPKDGVSKRLLDTDRRQQVARATAAYAKRQLRPIALAYKDFDHSQPDPYRRDDIFELAARDLIFIGTLGIQDPLRPEVIDAVRQCQTAGVFVRMVTGDNIDTAMSIAQECGIYTAGGLALDGPTFRALTDAERDVVVPRLQVLARSSPDDKQVLVRHLRRLGETVAVTGDGTNDAFALKAADVGFAMGVSGTDVAKEASAIILMDDNFASIVSALAWGRVINDSAKKFCQFQFTINITAGLLTIVTTLVESVDAAVFAVIQLLWLNLIMDIFAALALATDFPTKTLLQRRPEPRGAAIITPTMWKMVLGQAVYQLIVIFTLHYRGYEYFMGAGGGLGGDKGLGSERQMQTFVFNIYMFMQVFNQTNCRRTDNNLNVFEGIHRNLWFLVVQLITIGGQVAIILKGGSAFQTEPLTAEQWGWTLFFGLLTFPVGALIRMIPDELVLSFARRYLRPLAWPIIRIVRWSRERKLVQKLEKEFMEAAEAAAAERARRASNAEADDDDEPDEERRIRRMQWRWGKKHDPKKHALRQQVRKHIAESKTTTGETSEGSAVMDVGRAAEHSSSNATNPAENISDQVPPEDLVESLSRRLSKDGGRGLPAITTLPQGTNTLGCFHVHPDTLERDPVLIPRNFDGSQKHPPSQDPTVLQHMGFSLKSR
ncbi:uncharacterized protein B0I36DRAFT_406587 [Microdochium trichocladiopsis]|uniref:Calcium-transporting ATPase 2 n=1 Tax=Microdochium trichocladiopsis TaxID=1682393 RepID=A0A9P8YA35_9PEZI|nr:uncharacterized protein B0I36DRAFT_406587 [Microdochium trichocladiopsis]KAH7035854.1 hypothetical protein B0I36DRAFT_406587 [Microdochium trichocladiopsis]